MNIRYMSPACRRCGLVLMLLSLWLPLAAFGQAQSLGEFLDEQGRLAIPEGFTGSLDPEGFKMQTGADGTPRFVAQSGGNSVFGEWPTFGGVNFGCNGQVNSMAVDANGLVYLGGGFTVCAEAATSFIAAYDPVANEFNALGSGGQNGVDNTVRALAVSGDDVYVGGDFTEAGGEPASRVARWDGSGWATLGSGVANGVNQGVSALAAAGPAIHMGGFFGLAGGEVSSGIATFEIAAPPQVEIAPLEIDFGEIEMGSTSTQRVVTIENVGEGDLIVDSTSPDGENDSDFSVVADSCSGETAAPQKRCNVEITFTPTDAGQRIAQLPIPSNAPSSPDSASLTGSGTATDPPLVSLSPVSVDFGEVAIGGSSNRTTTVENTGTAALNIGNLSLSGSASDDYTLNVDNCSSTTLEPGETCT